MRLITLWKFHRNTKRNQPPLARLHINILSRAQVNPVRLTIDIIKFLNLISKVLNLNCLHICPLHVIFFHNYIYAKSLRLR